MGEAAPAGPLKSVEGDDDDDDERDRCMVEDAPALLAGPLKSVEATTTTTMSEIDVW